MAGVSTGSRALRDAVVRIVAGRFGPITGTPREMTFGHRSTTFRLLTDAGADLIVRTDADLNAYAGTGSNIAILGELGLPVPRVLDLDLSGSDVPFAWMILGAIPGKDLRFELSHMTSRQMSAVADRVVGFQRTVGGLPEGGGYGFAPLGVAAPHKRWLDAVRADRPQVRADPAMRELAVAVDLALGRAEQRLADLPATCFLDDLTIKNVIVEHGALRGIVDLDVVCFGDPMYWLALTQVAVVADLDPPAQFYVDELLRFWDPSERERSDFALWCAVHAAEFLTYDLAPARARRLLEKAMEWVSDG